MKRLLEWLRKIHHQRKKKKKKKTSCLCENQIHRNYKIEPKRVYNKIHVQIKGGI